MFIYPYRNGSKSVKGLKEGLDCKVIKREGSRYVPRANHTVINWGCSNMPDAIVATTNVLNTPLAVQAASNKLLFFELVKGEASIPEFTTDRNTALQWLNTGSMVVCRTILNGHSGEGIVIADHPDKVVAAPLYTKYEKKKDEYRIHIHVTSNGGVVFDRQKKARVREVGDNEVNWQVRNLAGGFIYQRNNIQVPKVVEDEAIKAFDCTGLDFGAVDVIYNANNNRAFVLEINTAPGLTGTTLDAYVNMFKEM